MKRSHSFSVLQADLRTRWRRGECVRVEDYLARDPGLAADSERLLDLIYHEVVLREEAGEPLCAADYYRRFPALADQLRPVFEVHEALAELPLASENLRAATTDQSQRPTKPSEEDPVEVPPALAGYDRLVELGRGGGGVVYRAHQRGLNRPVAVKVLASTAACSAARTARFRAEALLAARLQHPNIVQVFEVGTLDDGRPFFVMEYVKGGSLASHVTGNPQPANDAARLIATVARAVHHAHQAGIVHRDLKPANILLQVPDSARGTREEGGATTQVAEGDGAAGWRVGHAAHRSTTPSTRHQRSLPLTVLPKVADFGLAKDLADSGGASRTGDVIGTPSYMAPEQARGRVHEIGPWTDIYALGAILYELLTGRPPFQAATPLETLRLVLEEEPVPPERLVGKTPRDLQTVCLKCLHKEPSRRYATAADLADDLERFLDGRAVFARPVSRTECAARWARRHPSWVALGVVVGLAVVALGAIRLEESSREQRRLAATREEIQKSLEMGRRAFAEQGWSAAQARAAAVLERLDDEPALQELRPEAAYLHAEAGRRLAGEIADREKANALREFSRQRDAALFHWLITYARGSVLTGRPDAAHRAEARAAAARALALAGEDPATRFGQPALASDLGEDCTVLRLLTVASASRDRAFGVRKSALGYFLLGQEHFRRGDFAAARRAFEDAAALRSDHFWAQAFLAVCDLRQGRPAEARAVLTVCISLRRDFVPAWLLRGYCQRELGAFEGAEADYRQAARLLEREQNTELLYVLLVNRAVLRIQEAEAASLLPAAGVVALVAAGGSLTSPVGLVAAGADLLAEAVADLERAVRLRPAQYAAPLNLANAYRRQGRLADSDRALEQGYRLGPPPEVVADAQTKLGQFLLSQRRYQEAAALFKAAAAVVNHPAGTLLGQTWVHLHNYQEALQAFDRYLAQGGFPSVDVHRGRGLARLRLGLFAEAVEDFGRALDGRPDAELHLQRGWAYFFLDAWVLAERDFAQAIRLGTSQPDAWVGRGLARVMQGAYDNAVADAEETLRRRPTEADTYHNIACVFALAARRVETDSSDEKRTALASRFRARAVEAVAQALALLPAAGRAAFWRDKVRPDRALDAIRDTASFRRWEAEFGRG
jgi:serine/threonine protein kinase/tetratricopeptide (TPR) repeat protein